jgi:hypothetical protein
LFSFASYSFESWFVFEKSKRDIGSVNLRQFQTTESISTLLSDQFEFSNFDFSTTLSISNIDYSKYIVRNRLGEESSLSKSRTFDYFLQISLQYYGSQKNIQ